LAVAERSLSSEAFRYFLIHQNNDGFSSLNASCTAGHLEVVQTLLAVAERSLSSEAFRYFLIHQNNDGFSSLNASCNAGHLEVVQTLLEVAERSLSPEALQDFLIHQNNDGFSSLNASCKVGHLKVVQTLLEVAKRNLFPDAFRYLLTHQDKNGFSSLNTSCNAGHPEIVKCLVDAWIDDKDEYYNKQIFRKFIEEKNWCGFTPLNAAAKAALDNKRKQQVNAAALDNKRGQDHTDVLAYLLAVGANPDIPNKRGYTARKNFPYYPWPPRLLENAEDSEKNELKLYLPSASRHEKSLFFRPVPSAKPSHSIGHHHGSRHTMRTQAQNQ
jgi:hypothetical protein